MVSYVLHREVLRYWTAFLPYHKQLTFFNVRQLLYIECTDGLNCFG